MSNQPDDELARLNYAELNRDNDARIAELQNTIMAITGYAKKIEEQNIEMSEQLRKTEECNEQLQWKLSEHVRMKTMFKLYTHFFMLSFVREYFA